MRISKFSCFFIQKELCSHLLFLFKSLLEGQGFRWSTSRVTENVHTLEGHFVKIARHVDGRNLTSPVGFPHLHQGVSSDSRYQVVTGYLLAPVSITHLFSTYLFGVVFIRIVDKIAFQAEKLFAIKGFSAVFFVIFVKVLHFEWVKEAICQQWHCLNSRI